MSAPVPIISLDRSAPRHGRFPASWSATIAERYGLNLSDSWAEWFDTLAGDSIGAAEFNEPVHPSTLAEAVPEVIWPGLMLPDLLPVLGNGMGDWLCARVGADNTIREVIHWYHGGGDCLPNGRTLPEAIVYDAVRDRFPGNARRLAIPAEPPARQGFTLATLQPGLRWALTHLPGWVGEMLNPEAPAEELAERLLAAGIAEVPIRCDLILAALDNEVLRRMTPSTAAMLNVRWDQDVVRWMFDPELMPEPIRRRLAETWGKHPSAWLRPDWDLAAAHAAPIAAQRCDLAWPFDILGWWEQRRGRIEPAIGHYLQAAMASSFTDQSVRFRTHFDIDRVSKFSVARLLELGAADRLDPQYLQPLLQSPPADPRSIGWRDRISEYWLAPTEPEQSVRNPEGHGSRRAGEPLDRYERIYRAGWDVGCDALPRYRQLLSELAAAAEAAGQTARAAVARTHHACLIARYFSR